MQVPRNSRGGSEVEGEEGIRQNPEVLKVKKPASRSVKKNIRNGKK